jgi:NHS family xanthosine MFS transporter
MYDINKIEARCKELSAAVGDTFDIPVQLNGRLTRTLGRVHQEKKGEKWHSVKMEISKALLATATDESVRSVIDHEWAHYYVTKLTGESHGHDAEFKKVCAMIGCSLAKIESSYLQFAQSAALGMVLGIYSFTLPQCPITKGEKKSLVEALGLKAFALFKQKKMAVFFIFSMLLGVSLQITNGFANPFIGSFGLATEYKGTFGVEYTNILISLSQVSETLCILLIPFCLKRFGIKNVMLMAMFAWVLRFGLFGLGNPGTGVWMFVLSMIVYGVAFDFFNVSGSLYVNQETSSDIRSSAQGLFMIMTNGIGATIGTLGAQAVVNRFVPYYNVADKSTLLPEQVTSMLEGWSHTWLIFASYALVVAVLFAVVFKYKHTPQQS